MNVLSSSALQHAYILAHCCVLSFTIIGCAFEDSASSGPQATCGNGKLDVGEECDPGTVNTCVDGTTCDDTCTCAVIKVNASYTFRNQDVDNIHILLPNERRLMIYNYGQSKTKGLTLILFNVAKTNVAIDTAIFLVDADGTIEESWVGDNSLDVPWEWWAFGG